MKRFAWLLVVFAAGAVSCAPGDAPGGDVTVTDSAGVTIVVNGPGQMDGAEPWEVAPEPSLEIATEEGGDFVLFDVDHVVPLMGDRIALSNVATEVLVFDGFGALSLRLGGEGDGPGEFRRVASVMSFPGDSIGVYDGSHRRLSVFGPEGALAHERSRSGTPPRGTPEHA